MTLPLTFTSTDSNLSVTIEKVTPALAKTLLDTNHQNNRKIKPLTVSAYARQMTDGLWRSDSGEGISISNSGKLINGQHRLHAVIESGKTIELLMITGIPDSAMTCIDDGVPRSLSDAFTINNKSLPNQSAINGAVKTLMALRDCINSQKHYETELGLRRYAKSEQIAFFDSLSNFKKVAAQFFVTFKYSRISKTIPLGNALALYYLFHDQEEELVYSIFKSFESGIPMDNLREYSPCYHMYYRVGQNKLVKIRTRPWEYIMMWIWVFTKSLEGKKVSSMPKMEWSLNPENLVISKIAKKLRRL